MVDDYGHAIFESIKITLVCSTRARPGPRLLLHTHVRRTGVRRLHEDRCATPFPPTHTSTNTGFIHSQSLACVVVFADHPEKCARFLFPRTVLCACSDRLHCYDACAHSRAPTHRCRHKLASMPRWLSSKKVETVRALLAGVHAAFSPAPTDALLIACACPVRRGPGHAVRAAPCPALAATARP